MCVCLCVCVCARVEMIECGESENTTEMCGKSEPEQVLKWNYRTKYNVF